MEKNRDYKNKMLIRNINVDYEWRRRDFNHIYYSFSNVIKNINSSEEDIEIFKSLFYTKNDVDCCVSNFSAMFDYSCFYEQTSINGEVYFEIVSNIEYSSFYDALKMSLGEDYEIEILSYFYHYNDKESINVSHSLFHKYNVEKVNEDLENDLEKIKSELNSLKDDFKDILIDIVLNDNISENLITKLVSSIDNEILISALKKKDTSNISTDFIEKNIEER